MSSQCGNDDDNGDRQSRDPLEMGKLLCAKDLTITTEKSTTDITVTSTSQQVSFILYERFAFYFVDFTSCLRSFPNVVVKTRARFYTICHKA